MLEESRMDKKSLNRSSQSQSRASAVDCKKSNDLLQRPWPRNNKKREGTGSVPKNESCRKNVPSQRGRGQVDKRSRARGSTATTMGGAQNAGLDDDDDEPEIGSVFVPGSKKQNLNHLLNFMYPSRATQQEQFHGGRGPAPRRPQPRILRRLDQDLYLRAYCQFVVKEGGDYKANILDPDVPMKWEQIEEIIVRSTGKSECPICLGSPVAGRVGPCGHVHCWACALHYAAAKEVNPPPCPVCTTPLNVNDMKPTRMLQWESPSEEVTMRLVRRLRGSTTVELAPSRGYMSELETDPILPFECINGAPYAKLFRATNQQVRNILERDRKEIQDQILAEIDTTEIVYLEQALELLKLKEEKINMQVNFVKNIEPVKEEEVPIVYEKQEVNGNKLDWFDVNEEGAACAEILDNVDIIQEKVAEIDLVQSNLNPDAPAFEQNNVAPAEEFAFIDCDDFDDEQLKENNKINEIDKINQAKYFYFYQAEDGQQVFLNSLNVRIMSASWGALVAAPTVIKGRVLHRETMSLEDQMRKHMPYTAHLPLYCSFDVVELDLQPPYVTKDALDSFKEELDRRGRARARQQREERRRERVWRRAAEPPPRPDCSDRRMFPPALEPPPPDLRLHSPDHAPVSPPPGPSFAKMASSSGTWRVRQTSVRAPSPPPSDSECAPRTISLSDAIEAALQASPSPAAKKKKSKQKVLFAMGMQRSG